MFKFQYYSDIYTEKSADGVTCFRLDPGAAFEKWVHQNGAIYTGDYIEGCLLDNFVMATQRGYAAFYENYINEWKSDYYVEFQPGPALDVFSKWHNFEQKTGARA